MVFVKNVKYCRAECGEHIGNFAKELIDYRKETVCDVIGRFNDVGIEVTKETTQENKNIVVEKVFDMVIAMLLMTAKKIFILLLNIVEYGMIVSYREA